MSAADVSALYVDYSEYLALTYLTILVLSFSITGVTVGNALTGTSVTVSQVLIDLRNAIALLAYDWILCFGSEVSLVWTGHHKRTWASLVYAFSRYLPLVQYILQVVTIFPMSTLVSPVNHMHHE